MRSVAILVILVVGACSKSGPPDADAPRSDPPPALDPGPASDNPLPPSEPGPPRRPGGTDELKHLEGKGEDALKAELGEPTGTREFVMRDCCHEFEIELYNTYPPDDPKNADVQIRQWTWTYDGYAVTVWLHQVEGKWVALDTIRYADDVEF